MSPTDERDAGAEQPTEGDGSDSADDTAPATTTNRQGSAARAPDDAPSESPGADREYHVEVAPGEVADSVLLPGNPERVDAIVETWDDHHAVAHHREYRTATGTYADTPISVTSTGIGSPSTAIAIEELARVGADTFLRVGSCGALTADVPVGDLVISTGAVRQEGTTDEYVREDYPASADDRVVQALVAAAERLGHDYHVGVTCSTDSFYAGQSRPGFEGFEAAGADERVAELRSAGVLNFEMEASAVLTLGSLYDLRAGAVCAVYANRETGEFRRDGRRAAIETASLAVAYLARMDDAVASATADRWHAGLSVDEAGLPTGTDETGD